MRGTPALASSMGPSKTVKPSPFDNFRTTLQSLMSMLSVSAMFEVHTYVLLPRRTQSVPCCDLVVNQPVAPSEAALPRARMALPNDSFRGPSKTSSTSCAESTRNSLPPSLAKPSCRGTSPLLKYKQGLGISTRNGVPWLPVAVTHPVVPSDNALARIRMTPKPSSLLGPSTTSTTSRASSFLREVLVLISNSVVMAMSLTHL
mmetsp:Transcript_44812/g.126438  ORF Transcript_44812/g.126438 Transcript_44812/m.126438 type:complete len:203 (-) Transcript_44812:431-1039(-)